MQSFSFVGNCFAYFFTRKKPLFAIDFENVRQDCYPISLKESIVALCYNCFIEVQFSIAIYTIGLSSFRMHW